MHKLDMAPTDNLCSIFPAVLMLPQMSNHWKIVLNINDTKIASSKIAL